MADVKTNKEKLSLNQEMASRLEDLVNSCPELPWNQDYTDKEKGITLPIPVFGKNATPLRGIPALYLSTVMQLRGIEDPRFYMQEMLDKLNKSAYEENKKLPQEQQKNIKYGVKKGARSYLIKLATIVDKHYVNGKLVPIPSNEQQVAYSYVRLFSAADIVKRELVPAAEKGKYTVVNEVPLEPTSDHIKSVHYSLEEYKKHNDQLKEWLKNTGDEKLFISGAFDIVNDEKSAREQKRNEKFEKTNPNNFKYILPQSFSAWKQTGVPQEIVDKIVVADEKNNAIFLKEKLSNEVIKEFNLTPDYYHRSNNILAVDVYSVKDNAENVKPGIPLITAETLDMNFDSDYEKRYTGSFNRQLFTPNKLQKKCEVKTGDIVKMNDKVFYIDDNKTFKSIEIVHSSSANKDKIQPIEAAALKEHVEDFKKKVGTENYEEYKNKLQKLIVNGRSHNDNYAEWMNDASFVYGLNKSCYNLEGWEKADRAFAIIELVKNPETTLSDIEKTINFNSPGKAISDSKNYARDIMDSVVNHEAVKLALSARSAAAEKDMEAEEVAR